MRWVGQRGQRVSITWNIAQRLWQLFVWQGRGSKLAVLTQADIFTGETFPRDPCGAVSFLEGGVDHLRHCPARRRSSFGRSVKPHKVRRVLLSTPLDPTNRSLSSILSSTHIDLTPHLFTMSKPSATLVKDRVESGLYDAIGEQIVAMETAALAGAEYNRDYKRRVEAWSGNYVYKDTKGVDFRTIIVSEIQGSESGTIIAAKGNHYPGPRGTPVIINHLAWFFLIPILVSSFAPLPMTHGSRTY